MDSLALALALALALYKGHHWGIKFWPFLAFIEMWP